MEKKKTLHKEILKSVLGFFFFFCRKVYHLIVGSSWVRDILARFGYEMHLQNQGSPD